MNRMFVFSDPAKKYRSEWPEEHRVVACVANATANRHADPVAMGSGGAFATRLTPGKNLMTTGDPHL